jgi:hypothetical protein
MLIAIGIMAYFVGSAPALRCDIAMENWCIAQLPSSVSMKDTSKHREWTISLSEDVSASIIRIVEDKLCDGHLSYSGEKNSSGEFQILSAENCGIHVTVLEKKPDIASKVLVEQLILIKNGNGWVPLGSSLNQVQ